MNNNFLKYLDNFESNAVSEKPVRKTQVVPTKKPIVESDVVEISDDEYLSENGWKSRTDKWVDPITRNILIWEAAYAVQQERDRVDTLTEQVYIPSPRRQQMPSTPRKVNEPVLSLAEHASSILDGTSFDIDGGYNVPETIATYSQPIGDVGHDTNMMTEHVMSEEERLFEQAQNEYIVDQGAPTMRDPDTYRTQNDGLRMAELASGMF